MDQISLSDVLTIVGAILSFLSVSLVTIYKVLRMEIGKLNARIENVKDNYVRRDDLAEVKKTFLNEMRFIREGQEKTNDTLNAVLLKLGGKLNDNGKL